MEEAIVKALEILRSGGVVLYPTDTVWGLGCDATNAEAVEKIYQIKRRTDKLSMIVLTDRAENLVRYVRQVPEIAWELIEVADKPLTLILGNGVGVAKNLLPEAGTIAIRVPDHEFCKRLISRLARPLVSTSANISGEKTPARFSEISQEILDAVDYIVPSEFEVGATGLPSSIISLGMGGEISIIRP